MLAPTYPRRIVCLTEEPTEILYLLGEQDRIVGISGFTVRPKAAREKPKVSAFTSADYEKILALSPDLVVGFSDLQADIASELVRRGVAVLVFNQRSLEEILQVVLVLGGVVGKQAAAQRLVEGFVTTLEETRREGAALPAHPKVYFEEWGDPLISGIRWVEELVELAGGVPIFPELREAGLARERIVDPADVVRRDPDLILASWCGRKVKKDALVGRPGWDGIRAVREGRVHEIKSSLILQPGPAALTDGLAAIRQHVRDAAFAIASNAP